MTIKKIIEQNYDLRKYRSKVLDGLLYDMYLKVEKYIDENITEDGNFEELAYVKMIDIAKTQGTYSGLTFEQIQRNKQLSRDMKYWVEMDDGTYWFKSHEAEDWRFTIPVIKNMFEDIIYEDVPIQYIRFKDTRQFTALGKQAQKNRDAGEQGTRIYFKGTGRTYKDFWVNQIKICTNKLVTDSLNIPGRLYFYLTYGNIVSKRFDDMNIIQNDSNIDRAQVSRIPIFSDHIYYLALEIEAAFGEGLHNPDEKFGQILIKGRRLGITAFFSTGVALYNYTFIKGSKTDVLTKQAPHFKQFKVNMFNKGMLYLDEYTEFRQNRISFADGIPIAGISKKKQTSGSTIHYTATDKDSQKTVGANSDCLIYEEIGANDTFIQAISSSQPLCKIGNSRIAPDFGIGTGGDMKKGTIASFKVFFNPELHGFKGYKFRERNGVKVGKCGYFISSLWFNLDTFEGHRLFDEHGNSWLMLAYVHLSIQHYYWSLGDEQAQANIAYFPITPLDAFLQVEESDFDAVAITNQLEVIELEFKEGMYDDNIGRFVKIDHIKEEYIFEKCNREILITEYPLKDRSKKGAILMIDPPMITKQTRLGNNVGNVFNDQSVTNSTIIHTRYIMFIDSYDQKKSKTSKSLGGAMVYDRIEKKFVAYFLSRETLKDFYDQLLALARTYGAMVSYDSNTPGIDEFFIANKAADILIPAMLISGSNSVRDYGLPMTTPIISLGMGLLKAYVNDMDTELGINKLQLIKIAYLLQEILSYGRANTDLVTTMLGALVVDMYLTLNEQYASRLNTSTVDDLLEDNSIEAVMERFLKS